MNSIPTRHQHWVPKFYLAKFATPETRKKAMDKRRISAMSKGLALISPQPTSVRNFCGERYLYSPLDPAGERSMEVENLLGSVETRASAVWDEFAVERSDLRDPQLRETLAQFVATLHLRNKVVLDLIGTAMASRDKLYGGPSQEVLAKRGSGGPDATDPGRFFVHTLVNGIERMTTTFREKRWRILCTDTDVFVTSDRPVTFVDKTGRGGPGKSEVPILFPLTPRRILVMNGGPGEPRSDYADVVENNAALFNSALIGFCVKMFLTGRPVDEVTREFSSSGETQQS